MTSLCGDRPTILNLGKRNILVTYQSHSTITLRQRNARLSDTTFPAFLFVLRNAMQNYWIGLSQVNYSVVKWGAVTQRYCDTRRFDIHHKAQLRFVYSYCAREFCYSVLVIHRACAILRGSRG
jgi:hypothetical protein